VGLGKGETMRIAATGRAWLAALLVVGFAASCGKREPATGTAQQGGRVVAKVGNRDIHESQLDAIIKNLPQHEQSEYSGARGKIRLLDQMVSRDLLLQAAESRGLDKDPEVHQQLDDFRTNILVQAYQRKLVEALPQPTEEQIKKYFDEHPQEFTIPARVNASWIKCATKAAAEKARKRVVEGKENFGEVARQVSTDKETAADGGLLGYFNPIGYIRGLGSGDRAQEFAKRAFEVEANEVGPVFQWEDGWAFIKVHEKTTERAEPFSRARDRIVARLHPAFNDSLLNLELTKLRGTYKVETFIDLDKELDGKTADELMTMATESSDPHDKIEYYRALLRKYPHYERADEAQFMVGFVYSEELQDFESARPEYQKVLQNYPDSQVKESAHYMIQNMGHGKMPDFEGQKVAPGGESK
jgi:peptidyl-prolyl cis-trans isomerase C